MVRRTRDEALATREALLDAAERVFCASGVTRATLGDVASAAGVTRGAVWHFRDKGELFGAMCSRATLPMQSRLEQAADGDGDDAIATLREVSHGPCARSPRISYPSRARNPCSASRNV
ncbi:MAG: TetR family transcriptional regulator [Candidatus Accumulibacter sp.]|nr:TetR family transcriptional regulator [Candidatus Accumulibacter propinquus]